MPLIPAEVETAYRLILERTPSAAEITEVSAHHDRLGALRQTLLNSEEFSRKFDQIRDGFTKNLKPIVVHLQIPEAVDATLFDALAANSLLDPAIATDPNEFDALCNQPRPQRLKLRYIYGDLTPAAGAKLRLPHVHLCTIADPGPRLFRMYQRASAAQDATRMDFGTYLVNSVDSLPHRIELDNGQVRRLADNRTANGLGHESELLQAALHAATAPDMMFGLYEQTDTLFARLAHEKLVSPQDIPAKQARLPADRAYETALKGLDKGQRIVFDAYTAWDRYLYDVCAALIREPGAQPNS